MSTWLPKVLKRVHELAAAGQTQITYKALREAAGLGLSPEDVCDVVVALSTGDSAGRQPSETTGEWMYVFKPDVGGQILYVKLVLRESCVVVSFHADEGDGS